MKVSPKQYSNVTNVNNPKQVENLFKCSILMILVYLDEFILILSFSSSVTIRKNSAGIKHFQMRNYANRE